MSELATMRRLYNVNAPYEMPHFWEYALLDVAGQARFTYRMGFVDTRRQTRVQYPVENAVVACFWCAWQGGMAYRMVIAATTA